MSSTTTLSKQLFPFLILISLRLYSSFMLAIRVQIGFLKSIYYINSTKLAICHNKHIFSNRVFNKISKIGKSSYGLFLGFELHLIINKMCYR
ncbi:transposase DDE domain protein [Orientia tsutsugamushi str. UT76]|nr:transposase DDE domain protein [Orientia tsutsugamushi str. UT76]